MTLPGNNLQSQITDYVLLPMLSQTLCRKAVPEGVDFVARGVGARLHTGERRRQRRFDAREGARVASVNQGCVPEGAHCPYET